MRMPRLSDTMKVGVIRAWNKNVGDKVQPGDILAEVETDKATMDLEAFQEGVILYIAVESGEVPVDGIIAIIGTAGEDYKALLDQGTLALAPKPETTDKTPASPAASSNQPVNTPASSAMEKGRLKASPLARSMAKEAGIDIRAIQGTGESGRIIKKDVEASLQNPRKTAASTSPGYVSTQGDREVPTSQMRQTIAQRLSDSKFSAPHFYLTMEIDMDQCVEARNQINKISEHKISFNDLIIKACASALRSNPNVNVSWYGSKMIYHGDVNIGVAVAIEDGLVVPVIRSADQKTLSQINAEVADKATRAKNRKLGLDEMQGNTFTISNLGMFEIEEFTAIINPPDSCILAVGSILKKPAVKNDQITISHRMKVTLSCDHRSVDGATGAKFLQTLKGLLEQPISLIL
ncbi:MAG TPA: dihydrolipoamide acetyltransferase family protein [Saprospiraceae bacterium]|nr:dihydrolipoamide acetyltransferase family protein [Saprospiraceae bacterium]